MHQERYIIGIDGGGTKTRLALANARGDILARATTGHSNVHSSEKAFVVANIRKACRQLIHDAKLPDNLHISIIVAGLSGLDSPMDFTVARDTLWRACHGVVSSHDRIQLFNDTIIGFYAGSSSRVGLCVVGGTGSNCYGRNKRKEAWAGGLGHILADEGSGYDIGTRALRAAVKSFDGRGEKTLLEKLVFHHYGVHNPRALVPKVYYTRFGKHEIAQLALLVEQAAEKKDKVALAITAAAAQELLASVRAVAKNVAFTKSSVFDVVMIGGVLQKDPFVTRQFKAGLKKMFPKSRPLIPEIEPVIGAIRLGQERL
jgi:N-acetylglucosamine kinase-like BadF-type ATPase